ncbi:MAG: hypothetical protein QM791_02930 [Ferruginibacter sp.]
MDVKIGQSRADKVTSGTYNAINISVHVVAAAANTALTAAAFSPEQVSVKVILKRKKQTYIIMQDNLQTLGIFNTIDNGFHEFLNGVDVTYPASGVFAIKERQAKLMFGGHIRPSDGDELSCEVSVPNVGAFSSAANTTDSYVDFSFEPSIGYEYLIPMTISETLEANTSKQRFNPGDNVTRMVLLNLDKTNLTSQVVNNVTISSDRLDKNMNFAQLVLHSNQLLPRIPALRFGTSVPVSDGSPTVTKGLPFYPQTFFIFDGDAINNELDRCSVDIAANKAEVASGQNILAWRTYETTPELIAAAATRTQKHMDEKMDKVANKTS